MKVITKEELIALLSAKRGAFFATIFAETEPEMNKTKNPYYGLIKKQAVANVVLNWIYENAVNNQREREGLEPDFEAEPRKWGHRIPKSVFVEHKGNLYLESKIQKSLNHMYKLNGERISEKIIKKWLKKRSNKTRQGVKKEILLRDYKIENILSIRMDGEQYLVKRGVTQKSRESETD